MKNLGLVEKVFLVSFGVWGVKLYSQLQYNRGQIDARTDIDKSLRNIIKDFEEGIETHKEEA